MHTLVMHQQVIDGVETPTGWDVIFVCGNGTQLVIERNVEDWTEAANMVNCYNGGLGIAPNIIAKAVLGIQTSLENIGNELNSICSVLRA